MSRSIVTITACSFIFIFIHAGLVGDITLDNVPLKKFTMHCLDMKTSFINRFILSIFPCIVYL